MSNVLFNWIRRLGSTGKNMMAGWLAILRPYQQYSSQIGTIVRWYWNDVCNRTPYTTGRFRPPARTEAKTERPIFKDGCQVGKRRQNNGVSTPVHTLIQHRCQMEGFDIAFTYRLRYFWSCVLCFIFSQKLWVWKQQSIDSSWYLKTRKGIREFTLR